MCLARVVIQNFQNVGDHQETAKRTSSLPANLRTFEKISARGATKPDLTIPILELLDDNSSSRKLADYHDVTFCFRIVVDVSIISALFEG